MCSVEDTEGAELIGHCVKGQHIHGAILCCDATESRLCAQSDPPDQSVEAPHLAAGVITCGPRKSPASPRDCQQTVL